MTVYPPGCFAHRMRRPLPTRTIWTRTMPPPPMSASAGRRSPRQTGRAGSVPWPPAPWRGGLRWPPGGPRRRQPAAWRLRPAALPSLPWPPRPPRPRPGPWPVRVLRPSSSPPLPPSPLGQLRRRRRLPRSVPPLSPAFGLLRLLGPWLLLLPLPRQPLGGQWWRLVPQPQSVPRLTHHSCSQGPTLVQVPVVRRRQVRAR
mmetsp:Transcript_21851/g.62687  ORF Transcript_21851/g.62687 Transcript_21851/m.62687 type:complete len:201 (+) Transcript_21851:570-1172(+)